MFFVASPLASLARFNFRSLLSNVKSRQCGMPVLVRPGFMATGYRFSQQVIFYVNAFY